ncbi:hypothetical protein GQ55_7G085300 [Panicum hallii var. hallii]|uniref:Uncharacterized protein n=1 Tax=Panicum hallii var. hallii TaxID=1504633 RepID=A0A2T7CT52_9POAL|nr:hypothetical protein GQ55_7G085300 [Panicum hallii var. hallii]
MSRTIHEKPLCACRLRKEAVPCAPAVPHQSPPHPTPPPLPTALVANKPPLPSLALALSPTKLWRKNSPLLTKITVSSPEYVGGLAKERCRQASPPPRPLLPRRRLTRKLFPSFSFLISSTSRINLTRSTPTLSYTKRRPFAHALLIAGELASPLLFRSFIFNQTL